MDMKLLTRYFVLFAVLLSPHILYAQAMRQMMEKDPVTGASIFRPYFHDESKNAEMSVGGAGISRFISPILADMGPDTILSQSRGSILLTVLKRHRLWVP